MSTKHVSPAEKLGSKSTSGKTMNGDPTGQKRSGSGPDEVTFEDIKAPKMKQ